MIEKLQKMYADTLKDYVEYILSRSEVCDERPIKNRDEAKQFLIDFDFLDGEWESSAWEAGYLRGLEEAISVLSTNEKENDGH